MWFAATQQKQSCTSHLNFIISFSPHLLLLPLFVCFLLASLYFFPFLPIANPNSVWGYLARFKRLVLHSKPWQMNAVFCLLVLRWMWEKREMIVYGGCTETFTWDVSWAAWISCSCISTWLLCRSVQLVSAQEHITLFGGQFECYASMFVLFQNNKVWLSPFSYVTLMSSLMEKNSSYLLVTVLYDPTKYNGENFALLMFSFCMYGNTNCG